MDIDFKKQIIFLIFILIIASFVRVTFVDSLRDADSFYHVRMTEYLILNDSIPERDPLAYYHVGGSPILRFTLLWPTATYTYSLFFDEYSKENLMLVAFYFPVVFSLIILLFVFLILSELFKNKKLVLLGTLFLAIVPAFFVRSSGYFEGDLFGLSFAIIGIYFLVRLIKLHTFKKNNFENKIQKLIHNKYLNLVLSAIFFGLIAWVWEGYIVFLSILVAFTGTQSIYLVKEKSNINLYFSFLTIIIISFLLSYLSGANFYGSLNGIIFPMIVISLIISGIIEKYKTKISKEKRSLIFNLVILSFFIISFIFLAISFFPDVIRDTSSTSKLISEHQSGIGFIAPYFGISYIFILASLIIFPILLKKSKRREFILFYLALLLFFILNVLYVKFAFLLGLFFSFVLVFVLDYLIKNFSNICKKINCSNPDFLKQGFFIIFILISSLFLIQSLFLISNIEEFHSYGQISQLEESFPKDYFKDKNFINWWSEGHMMTFLLNSKVVIDNRNWAGYKPKKDIALFFLDNNVESAYSFAKSISADYIFIDESYFYLTGHFLSEYDEEINKDYFNLAKVAIFECTTKNNLVCGGDEINENNIISNWISEPNGAEKSFIYIENNKAYRFNSFLNNTNLVKIWFNSEQTREKYEEIYSNGSSKVFRII